MEHFGYVYASKMLVEKKLPVRFMYREKNPRGVKEDSGWRFLCGLESQSYLDDPDNIGMYDIETILAIDESIRPYLGSLYGRAYTRPDGAAPFKRKLDYTFGSDLDVT